MKRFMPRILAAGIAVLPAILCLAVMLLLPKSGEGSSFRVRETFAMDTVLSFRLPETVTEEQYQGLLQEIQRLESLFSRTASGGLTARINESAEEVQVDDPDFVALLTGSLELSERTDGAFDLTAGALTDLWSVTQENPTIPDESAIRKTLESVGYRKLSFRDGYLSKESAEVSLDFGGCAKGYICESAVNLLKSHGVQSGILSFGGNIGIIGPMEGNSTCKIGIANPDSPDFAAGYLSIGSGFVSVSGDYERYFEKDGVRYHHIFDPKTGRPAQSGVRSVAVWSEDGAVADALSTALFVMGIQRALSFYESGSYSFEAVFYLSDGSYYATDGIRNCYEHVSDSFSRIYGTD